MQCRSVSGGAFWGRSLVHYYIMLHTKTNRYLVVILPFIGGEYYMASSNCLSSAISRAKLEIKNFRGSARVVVVDSTLTEGNVIWGQYEQSK